MAEQTPTPLERVQRADQHLREVAARAKAELNERVYEARRAGHAWEEIADALGVSRQSAWEKFREYVRDHRGTPMFDSQI